MKTIVVLLFLTYVKTISTWYFPDNFYQNQERSSNDEIQIESEKDIKSQLLDGLQESSLYLLQDRLRNFPISSNIVLSPFSIWLTLFVLYMGAKGETESELSKLLKIGNVSKSDLLSQYQSFNKEATLSESYSIANKIFIDEHLQLNNFIEENFADETQKVNFRDEPETCRLRINKWVEEKTNNKIQEQLTPDMVNSYTNLIIANAIYFKEKWLHEFDPMNTIKGIFQKSPYESVEANFMQQRASLKCARMRNIRSTVLELPYSNRNMSMILILPDRQYSLRGIIQSLTVEKLKKVFAAFKNEYYESRVNMKIPKFKFLQDHDLYSFLYSNNILGRDSDFSGFLKEGYNTDERIEINSFIHKAFISNDEKGTEAAAATTGVSLRMMPRRTTFIADRPFMFLIKPKDLDTILFSGVVYEPNQDS